MLYRSALLVAATLASMPAWAQVGVSIDIQKPGVYGRIEIGNQPPPLVVYPQPVIITPVRVQREPLYLYVPPGHQKKWSKHCARYDACGRPVYFVREDWVRDRYERYEREHGHGDDRGPKHGHGKHKHKHGHHD